MTKPVLWDLNIFEQMKIAPGIAICLFSLLMACHGDETALVKLDLEPNGLPITIMAPDSSEILEKDYAFMRDVTVRKGESFFIQIFEFDAPKQDAAGEKLRQLAAVKEDPFFREVISEEDQGFVFSTLADSSITQYDFRFVRILGEKELIFQTGLVGSFSLDDVLLMYKAVSTDN